MFLWKFLGRSSQLAFTGEVTHVGMDERIHCQSDGRELL